MSYPNNPSNLVSHVPTLDTNIYASGDLLADTKIVTGAFWRAGGSGILPSLFIIDSDDQGAAFDVYLLDANVSMGTINIAPSITDANAAHIMARIQVGTGDYFDLGGCRIADLTLLNRIIRAADNSKDIYCAIVNGTGTPTYTASGLLLRFGILPD